MIKTITIFRSKEEAENILKLMNGVIRDYGVVTIADFYDLIGFANYNYEATKVGWTDLSASEIANEFGTAWTIIFPDYNWNGA